jgi:FkbM family methyltransferase
MIKAFLEKLGLGAVAAQLVEFSTRFGQRTYSQEGEDFILTRFFEAKCDGFFVDVGAHHPYRFSNTYLLYRRGWRGVNIDAMPGSMRKFERCRPRDVNVEAAVGLAVGSATYYMFNEPALNTFDPTLAAERQAPPWKIIKEVSLPIMPLAGILEKFVPQGQFIDLLTVDVEGRDLEVLRSNDWSRFRPKIVLAETLGRRLDDLRADPVVEYLGSLGYVLAARTFNTTFMVDVSAQA